MNLLRVYLESALCRELPETDFTSKEEGGYLTQYMLKAKHRRTLKEIQQQVYSDACFCSDIQFCQE